MLKSLLKKKFNKKGFTLIELIIVIVVLAILAAVLIPSISGYIAEVQDGKILADARSTFMAVATVAASDYAAGVEQDGEDYGSEEATAARVLALINVKGTWTADVTNGNIDEESFTYTEGGITYLYDKDNKFVKQ